MALTAAASPISLPQSSTGRLEVSMVLASLELKYEAGRYCRQI
jgi:hypothetical protein